MSVEKTIVITVVAIILHFCFEDELKPVVKDFPNRHFKQLTIEEQQKILELEVRQ